jgi:hypothetical protein
MAAKLTRLTHKIAKQLHLAVESCTICSSHARRPVRKLLDTSSYVLSFSWCSFAFRDSTHHSSSQATFLSRTTFLLLTALQVCFKHNFSKVLLVYVRLFLRPSGRHYFEPKALMNVSTDHLHFNNVLSNFKCSSVTVN